MKADNMDVTIAENKDLEYRKKIQEFYVRSKQCKSKGFCPVQDIMVPCSDKWSLFIIYNLAFNGVLRFNALKNYIPGVSSRMLSVSLKKLESSGIVKREVYAEVPPRVEYSLTAFGNAFSKKLLDLNLWLIDEHPLITH